MEKPKNVLFLLVDQWPADSFGFLGSPCSTPNIDKLAARGTVFSNAFTTCPLCTPARAALLTGRWPHQTGVYDNCGVGYSNQPDLATSTLTWLDHSLTAGYRVGYFGKWHLGTEGLKSRGLHGYDKPGESFKPYTERPGFSYDSIKAFYESSVESLARGKPPFWGETTGDAEDTKCARSVQAGLSFLKEHCDEGRDEPFFLTISIADPHFPHYLASSVIAKREPLDISCPGNFKDDFNGKPAFQKENWWPCHDTKDLTDQDWKHIFDYAMRHREYVDAYLGQVLDYLESKGLTEDTLIVFTSDHGDMCGAHNRFDKGPYFYDEVWRVPLIISSPGESACTNAEYISLIDLGRYFNRYFGSANEPDGALQIKDEIGVAKSRPEKSTEAYGVYDAYNGYWFGIRAVRNERFKYVRNYGEVDEFYDLHDDPHELTNAINNPKHQPMIATMSDMIDTFLKRIDDPIDRFKSLPEPGEVVHVIKYR